jgi:MoaA/NifB/PqqE/SkfB family radical SAM enzyme
MGCFNHDQYVEFTMHFRCNLHCEHCMIEGTMDRLEPESMERFQELMDYNRQQLRWKALVLTGAEITLRRDLPDLARRARSNGFEHVRIQTHGMRLADESYCRELIAAGVDEYFVSVTAPDAETHDEITKVPGSFNKTLRGLEILDGFDGVITCTNTVITERTYRHLPRVVERLGHLRRLAQMDFWTYWPMSEQDDKDLIASHLDVQPYLKEAIVKARALGRSVEVKNFPECLLGDVHDALENVQPRLFIDPSFWKEFKRNGFEKCAHREVCRSRGCLGLNTAYVRKFGLQSDALTPYATEPAPVPPATPELDSGPYPVIQIAGLEPIRPLSFDQHQGARPESNPRARLLRGLVAGLKTPFVHERSFRVCQGAILSNRFLLSICKDEVGPNPHKKLREVCQRLGMPEAFINHAGRLLAAAPYLHFGYEENRTSSLYKVYLEMGVIADRPLGSDPMLLYLAFKWDPSEPSRTAMSRYFWYPGMSVPDMVGRIAAIYGDGNEGESFDIARGILMSAEDRIGQGMVRYVEVTEDKNPRKSFELNLYDARLQIKHLAPFLVRMARHYSILADQIQAVVESNQSQVVGHLAGGTHREGEDFFNVYYGMEKRHGLGEDITA